MGDIKSSAKPPPAALVTGGDSPEGLSVAAALARLGYRVCLLHSEGGAASVEPAGLPGHERLRHEAICADLARPGAAEAAAIEAQQRLGQVTALVHVAVPSAAPEPEGGFDGAALARELQLGAGAFLGLAAALLPGMLGTQTGCLSVLTRAPADGASLAAGGWGAGASLGALLGAVRQLADRCEGTQLRSIALLSDGAGGRALGGAAAATSAAQLGLERSPDLLPSGWFLRLAPPLRGPIELLRAPASVVTSAAPEPPLPARNGVQAPAQNDRLGQKLAQTFRSAFGLAAGVDVSKLGVADVKRWDSLGHLKLMMEVEQALRVRLPAEALARIQSYRDLEKAVRAYLPAT